MNYMIVASQATDAAASEESQKGLTRNALQGDIMVFERPFGPEEEAAMFTFTVGIFIAIFVVFVVVPLIVIGSVRLFLSILDESRRVPPHTLRRIH